MRPGSLLPTITTSFEARVVACNTARHKQDHRRVRDFSSGGAKTGFPRAWNTPQLEGGFKGPPPGDF